MSTSSDTISVDHFIPRPAAQIWQALTTPELLAQWWVPGDISAVVGARFLLEMPGWGNVPCEVLEVDEPHRLVYTFDDWTLTWRLVPEGRGTRVFLDQSGFDLNNPQHRFAFDNMVAGWSDEVLPRLATLVTAGS